MNKYNPHIYHRRSIRLKGYDYSQAGLYFITICCHNMNWLLGRVVNDEIILNNVGIHANNCWIEIPKHFPNVELHEHIVMPNHIHGIIELKTQSIVGRENILPQNQNKENDIGVDNSVGANNHSPLRYIPQQPQSPSKTIGSIVRGYKIGVTKWIRQNTEVINVWQRNYYEHIIRNEKSYDTIREYIINNPAQWAVDKFNNK